LRSPWGIAVLCLLSALSGAERAFAADGGLVAGLSRALAFEESRSGAESPHLLPLLEQLAGAQFDDGALAQAAESRRRALKIALAAFGSQSADAADAMTALAEIDILRHDYLGAEPLLTVAANVLSARLGAGNQALSQPLSGLARLALARGDVKLAETLASRANAIAPRDPRRSSEPLRVLGAVYAVEQRFDQGEAVLRQAVTRDRRAHGDAGVETARSLAQLGNLLLHAKRFAEALPPIEQALAIDQAHLGPTHPLIADDFCDLGLTYAGLNRHADATRMLAYAIGLLEQGSGKDSSRLAYAALDLAGVLDTMGYNDAADAAFAEGKRILDEAGHDERQREREL
jgi:tetratricopeptide (TPR) repeat protein